MEYYLSHYILDEPMVSLALLESSSLVTLLGLPQQYQPFSDNLAVVLDFFILQHKHN
jgi:hypothetical protein